MRAAAYRRRIASIAPACEPPADLVAFPRAFLEITQLTLRYLGDDGVRVRRRGRSVAWLNAGATESLPGTSTNVAAAGRRQGVRTGAIKDAVFRQGFFDVAAALRLTAQCRGNPDGAYRGLFVHPPFASPAPCA